MRVTFSIHTKLHNLSQYASDEPGHQCLFDRISPFQKNTNQQKMICNLEYFYIQMLFSVKVVLEKPFQPYDSFKYLQWLSKDDHYDDMSKSTFIQKPQLSSTQNHESLIYSSQLFLLGDSRLLQMTTQKQFHIIITYDQLFMTFRQLNSSQEYQNDTNVQQMAVTNKKHKEKKVFVGLRPIISKKQKDEPLEPKSNKDQGYKTSLWTLSENIAYMKFLLGNEELFYTSRYERKAMRINVLMAQAVGTRSPDQCRSHHQKMMKYHQDIPNIILHIQGLCDLREEAQSVQSPKIDEQRSREEEKSFPNHFLTLCSQLSIQTYQNQIIFPIYEWESWVDRNELMEQERLVQSWFDGVQDKYGNL